MRIWYQSGVEAGKALNYRRALETHFRRIAQSSTEVHLSGVPAGTWKGMSAAEASSYPYLFYTRGCMAFLENAIKAQQEGYDAFVVGAFTEPAVRQIRAAVDMPVVSGFEASILTGCSVSHTLGLIVPTEEIAYFARLNVKRSELAGRVGAIEVMSPALTDDELNRAFDHPGPVLERFEAAARRALACYCDAIIPAEGIIAEIVATHGPAHFDGAPVLDAVGIPIMYAEYLGGLWARTGLRTARRWHYRKPSSDLIDN